MTSYSESVHPLLTLIPEIVNAFDQYSTLILQSPPGTGKSTVLPLELLSAPFLDKKKILILEPRRLAAKSVAQRMSYLRKEELGNTIGYRIRFESKISKSTRIEVVTEGILSKMLQSDPELKEVGLVLFDEFHERNIHSDVALVLCREIQEVLRPDLKLLVMSATMDTQELSAFLNNAPILATEAQHHPLDIQYLGYDSREKLEVQVTRAISKALRDTEGDILVFLPGIAEIKRVERSVTELLPRNTLVEVLYGDLSFVAQQKVLKPNEEGKRKIILSTSIAETSLTIEGVRVVIDSGLSRTSMYDAKSGLQGLETIKVTKDAADQRAGRANRLGAGTCYRLWDENAHHFLEEHRTPQILHSDLIPLVLELAHWGYSDPLKLRWLTPPSLGSVEQAKDFLSAISALENGKLTARGKDLLAFPTHPRIAHLLLEGEVLKEVSLAADIAALLEEKDLLPQGVDIQARLDLLYSFRQKKALNADKNLLERIERLSKTWKGYFNVRTDLEPPSWGKAGILLSRAFPERIAKRLDNATGRYKLSNGKLAKLPEEDELIMEEWIVVIQMDTRSYEGKIFLAAPLPIEVVHACLTFEDIVQWDVQKGVLVSHRAWKMGQIVSHTEVVANVDLSVRVRAVCDGIRKEGIKIFAWGEEENQWFARVSSLRIWQGADTWPDVSEEVLLATLEEWLSPFLERVKKREDVQKLDWNAILPTLLSWEQQQMLKEEAKQTLQVPSGSVIKLHYFVDGSPPLLSVRLQEMFGCLDSPRVNRGRNAIRIQLLSPGFKPVQLTQDLRSFWGTTYHEVRKELRSRYPKHSWPEDPWTAQAVRGVKKKG